MSDEQMKPLPVVNTVGLQRLLCEIFVTYTDFSRFLQKLSGFSQFRHELPVWNATDSLANLLFLTVPTLSRRGLLDTNFFRYLAEHSPDKREEIGRFMIDLPVPSYPQTPKYPNEETRRLSQDLAEAQARKLRLMEVGACTLEANEAIMKLKRHLREGGQLRAGDELEGRFLLLEQIGRGGFAQVWKAHDKQFSEVIAIKVLHSNLAGDPHLRDRFLRGARIMSELNNPGIVRVLMSHGEDSGWHYFTMEYMPGGDLRNAVLNKLLSQEKFFSIILKVGEVLSLAHSRSIVHRDVKPANILLDGNSDPRLADFDLVTAGDTFGGTRTGAMGTLLYAAPELYQHPQDADARADVFGLGMTAAFCLSGAEVPFTVLGPGQAAKFITTLPCSEPIKAVLKKAVHWAATSRFPNAGDFCTALSEALHRKSHREHLQPAKKTKKGTSEPRPLTQAEQPNSKRRYGVPDFTERGIIKALSHFDRDYRATSAWLAWEQNTHFDYAIEYRERRYPVKQIISLATGLPRSAFTGGRQANERLRAIGFQIIELRRNGDTGAPTTD